MSVMFRVTFEAREFRELSDYKGIFKACGVRKKRRGVRNEMQGIKYEWEIKQ